LSGEEGSDRDGTNNVQRAKPNMAGSPAGKIKMGKNKNADPDDEIYEGSKRQQTKRVGNEVSRSRNKGQQGARMRRQHSPQHSDENQVKPDAQGRENAENADTENDDDNTTVGAEEQDENVIKPEPKKKSKKELRREKRRKKGT
jgi:hypothetical protein